MVAGTDRFMSPEGFSSASAGGGITEKSDVFSYGTLAWTLLTGRLPFNQPFEKCSTGTDSQSSFIVAYKTLVEASGRTASSPTSASPLPALLDGFTPPFPTILWGLLSCRPGDRSLPG